MLNHVCAHQASSGSRPRSRWLAGGHTRRRGRCVGGGSNYAGLSFSYAADVLAGAPRPISSRRARCLSHADTQHLRLRLRRHRGDDPVDAHVHARSRLRPGPRPHGPARYHGDAPSLCGLVKAGLYEAKTYPQVPVFEAAVMFARSEGWLPGPGQPTRSRERSMRHLPRARPTRSESCCQPVRPRPFRHQCLRGLSRRQAQGPATERGGPGRLTGKPSPSAGERLGDRRSPQSTKRDGSPRHFPRRARISCGLYA